MNIRGHFYLTLLMLLLVPTVSGEALLVNTVKQITIADLLTFTGTVEAVNSGTASSETSGRVVETLVDVGDLVNKDDVILKLRDTQQRANLDSAVAGVKAAQAKYDAAKKENARVSDILKKRLVSQSVADKALSEKDASKAALDSAQARLIKAEEQLDYTRVKAPYSGIVLERHIEVGETVNVGSPLYTGMSLEFLRVIADVPQKDIDNIRQNKMATIELPDASTIELSGAALTFFGYADPVTSTFKIRVNLPQGTQGLYPGMYLKTAFEVGKRTVLMVPIKSVVHRGEVTAVYVQKDDYLDFRQIRIGQVIDTDFVEILSGLAEGEKVITSPAQAITFLKTGEKVEVGDE